MRTAHPTVLIVDGESDQREFLAALLQAGGFDVRQAADAAQAVQRLTSAPADALVVDVRLPDDTGANVIAFAAARNTAAIAIAVAGSLELLHDAPAGNAAFATLVKPYQLPQVPRLLRAELDRRRVEEENERLRARLQDAAPFPEGIPDEGINFTSLVSRLERALILRCLEKTGGNKRQAARLLQLSRTTLIDKIHRLKRDDAVVESPA